MNARDLTRIAATLRHAADLIDSTGPEALDIAGRASAVSTLRATSYDHGHGSVRRDEEGELVPNDPTGEAAMAILSERAPRNALRAALDAAAGAAQRLGDLLVRTVLDAPERPVQEEGDDIDAGEGGCASCFRDNRHYQPVATHADGRVKYARSCDWCRGFERTYRTLPPLSILRLHHQGKRIFVERIEKALQHERMEREKMAKGAAKRVKRS